MIEHLEGMPEEERLAKIADIQRAMPDRDLTHVLGGALAGPATADRPDVPPWDYLQYVAGHPETSLESLCAIRFPVIFSGGDQSTIESIDDYTYLDPRLGGVRTTIAEQVDRYALLHAAGLIRWNSELRAVEHLVPFAAFAPVLEKWASDLERPASDR